MKQSKAVLFFFCQCMENTANGITQLRDYKYRTDLNKIPASTRMLVIHGNEDQLVPFSKGEEIACAMPRARIVKVGQKRGEVPSYEFGHVWYEYFEVDTWMGVIESFVDDENN